MLCMKCEKGPREQICSCGRRPQDKFEEKWGSSMVQKLNDEAAVCRTEEVQASRRSIAETKVILPHFLSDLLAIFHGMLSAVEFGKDSAFLSKSCNALKV